MLNRRTLLFTPALAAAADRKPIGIAFLGTSHSHAEGKIEAVRNNPAFRLAGVSELTPKFKDLPLLRREELLRSPDVEVIAVESAVRDHGRDGIAVLEAGKHLHLEKAPADNLKEFARIVELAKSKKRLLQIGYMWRYHPGIQLALEAVKNGWLGEVYMVRACIGNQLEAARRPEWAEFKGGTMFELGCHVLDPIVRMLGKPSRVTPMLHKHGAFNDTLNDNNLAVLEYPKAMAIVYGANMQPNSGRHRAFEVQGTNGNILINPIEPPNMIVELAKPAGPYKAGAQNIPMPPYKRYADDFVELAVAIRGEASLRVTPDENLLVQEVVLRASGML